VEFEKVTAGCSRRNHREQSHRREIIWAGTKGLFFTFAVMCILTLFRIIQLPQGLLAPLVGFLTGLMFATLSLWVTSYVKTINHFNFYLTGVISPMFFFSGVVFPISNLPLSAVHRGSCRRRTQSRRAGDLHEPIPVSLLADLVYIAVFIIVIGLRHPSLDAGWLRGRSIPSVLASTSPEQCLSFVLCFILHRQAVTGRPW
jgi:lipooligosaccharide transport system permease protein